MVPPGRPVAVNGERRHVRRNGRDGNPPPDIDWQSIADPAATSVIYMPKRTLREFSRRAIAHGLDSATPAIAVVNATRPGETLATATIATIADRPDAAMLNGPALVMIGRVLADVHQADGRDALMGTGTGRDRRRRSSTANLSPQNRQLFQ